MRKVYRTDFCTDKKQKVLAPSSFKAIRANTERGCICVWLEAEEDSPIIEKSFLLLHDYELVPKNINLSYCIAKEGYVLYEIL